MKKFNIIDGLIIAVIIVVIAFAGYRLYKRGSDIVLTTYPIEVTIMAQSVGKEVAAELEVGEEVIINAREKDAMKIKSVSVRNAMTMTYDSINGTYQMLENPDKKDIDIILEGTATDTALEYQVGKTPIKVGVLLSAHGRRYGVSGYVMDFEVSK